MSYAIVQHSSFGYTQHEEFRHAVEAHFCTPSRGRRVRAAGGEVFESYLDADTFAEAANYPPSVQGLVPHVRGTFSDIVTVDGLAIYIPVRKVEH